MPKAGKQRIQNYGLDFKLRAVQLSHQPGVLVKDVADSLDIHPFMLSKWRKQVRDGVLKGNLPSIEPRAVSELQRLRDVAKKYKRLVMEHDLLNRAIRFASGRRTTSSPSSRQTGKTSPSK